jgi:hypothetical protein
MTNRSVIGWAAVIMAVLTLYEIYYMVGMLTSTTAGGGTAGPGPWAGATFLLFLFSMAPLVATAVLLLLARDEQPHH